MSDPFERLVRSGGADAAPDLDAIRLRAHRLRRRRQTGLASAGAAAMAIIAVVGVMLATGPGNEASTSLTEELRPTTAPTLSPPVPAGISVAEGGKKASRTVSGGATTSGSSGASGSAPSSEGRTTSDNAGAVSAPAKEADTPELEATIAVEDQMIGRGKTFTLKVCNTTSGAVKRSFGSSQRYDFEVSRGGELVWRWSDGQFFTQVVGEETWKAKECKEWSENWDASRSDGGRAPAGDYEAEGVLKTSPELRTAPKTFAVSTL